MLQELSFIFCINSSCGHVPCQPLKDTEKKLLHLFYVFACTLCTNGCIKQRYKLEEAGPGREIQELFKACLRRLAQVVFAR